MSIIERILSLLKKRGFLMVDLAKHLNINTSTLSNWKLYNRNPPAEYIYPICEFLEVSPEYLLTGKESNTSSSASQPTGLHICEPTASYAVRGKSDKIDPNLEWMIDTLTAIMSDPDPNRRIWAVVQFKDAFKGYCHISYEKKLHSSS